MWRMIFLIALAGNLLMFALGIWFAFTTTKGDEVTYVILALVNLTVAGLLAVNVASERVDR